MKFVRMFRDQITCMIACLLSEFRIPSGINPPRAKNAGRQKVILHRFSADTIFGNLRLPPLHHNLISECERFRPLLRIKWIQLNQQLN
jgi:hypothetical protein